MVAEVVFPLAVDKIFRYKIPAKVEDIKLGVRVRVPFRDKIRIGYLVGISSDWERDLKEIIEVLDSEPILSPDILSLTSWMAGHYYASWGECIQASLPGILRKGRKTSIPRKEYIIQPDRGFQKPIKLTTAQQKALRAIKKYGLDGFKVYLVYGVTGSGKTEVYIRTIEQVLGNGRGVIVLVPEIALTPQTISRFQNRIDSKISVLHSDLTESQRFQSWLRLKQGESLVCIGTRSAIFAPIKNLGLIVIDEEHESSYKQEESPRYHTREVAIRRAQIAGCPVILGSATPSLESYYKALNGEYHLIELPERAKKKEMPEVRIIDLRQIGRRGFKPLVFSPPLKQEIAEILKNGMQVILFLNRRGFSTYVSCLKCGYVARCPDCELAYTYHSKGNRLICHHCNRQEKRPLICPECKSRYLSFRGIGTQRVESELHKLFPGIRTARLDSDALRKKGYLEKTIEDFKNKKIDVIVGTQVVAKGHDFPNVELVGVILADLSLNIVDFRAGERTFSLLTQVAGRSGRGLSTGKVIVQTYSPEHYTIRTSLSHDYRSFYQEEIEKRKMLNFPPFSELIKVEFRHPKEEKVKKVAYEIKEVLSQFREEDFEILGPAPHPLPKIRNIYRWNLLLEGKNVEHMLRLLYNIIGFRRRVEGVQIVVDVNPYED